MDEYGEVKDECPSCGRVIGETGVRSIDAYSGDRFGYDPHIRVVRIDCHCGYEWREVLGLPEEEFSAGDRSLSEFP